MARVTGLQRFLPLLLLAAAAMLIVSASTTANNATHGSMSIVVANEVALLDSGSFTFTARSCVHCDLSPPWECGGPLPSPHPRCSTQPNCYCMYCNGEWGCFPADFEIAK